MALGFKNAGFKSAGAFDSWEAAVVTFNANVGHDATLATIGENIDLPESTVIIGGPPCQGFSSAGMRRAGDERNSLVSIFARTIARVRPTAFVFENVEGFLTSEDGIFVRHLLEPLISAGYRIHLRKINAANYGVPQHRKRVIAIGGLGWEPTFPKPTHSAFGAPGSLRATPTLPFGRTIREALAGLPRPSAIAPGEPHGHVLQSLEGVDLERAKLLRPGQTMRDLPPELWHESYRKRAFRRVMDGMPTEKRGGAPAGLRRLDFDLPSKAITGGAIGEFLHPLEDRPLTIRECARLQTFPDSFCFSGKLTEQIQQIGNAVPPLLAKVIAQNLMADLARADKMEREAGIASFIPTSASGMSPVLQRVVGMVDGLYRSAEVARQDELWH